MDLNAGPFFCRAISPGPVYCLLSIFINFVTDALGDIKLQIEYTHTYSIYTISVGVSYSTLRGKKRKENLLAKIPGDRKQF